MKNYTPRIATTFLCLSILLGFTGCINRDSPWFKSWREDERAEMNEQIRKLISETPRLQLLESLCREVVYFSAVEPLRIGINKERDTLYFGYKLDLELKTVQNGATEFLEARGWKMTKSQSGLWEEQIEFEKNEYWIQIAHGNAGDMNYYVNCSDKGGSHR